MARGDRKSASYSANCIIACKCLSSYNISWKRRRADLSLALSGKGISHSMTRTHVPIHFIGFICPAHPVITRWVQGRTRASWAVGDDVICKVSAYCNKSQVHNSPVSIFPQVAKMLSGRYTKAFRNDAHTSRKGCLQSTQSRPKRLWRISESHARGIPTKKRSARIRADRSHPCVADDDYLPWARDSS